MPKYYHLKNLEVGTPFLMRSFTLMYRNMVLIQASDSRCVVRGEHQVDGSWVHYTDSVSPTVEVYVDTSRPMEKITEEEEDSTTTEQENQDDSMKRGRKKIHSLTLPINKEFTVAQLAAELGVEKYVINNEIARVKASTPEKLTEKAAEKSGQRGKPATVFKYQP